MRGYRAILSRRHLLRYGAGLVLGGCTARIEHGSRAMGGAGGAAGAGGAGGGSGGATAGSAPGGAAGSSGQGGDSGGEAGAAGATPTDFTKAVSVLQCASYEPAVVSAVLASAFDAIGGIESIVKGKTVTIKLNLTGSDPAPILGRSAAETYMTHPTVGAALAYLLFQAGAYRVRFVESSGVDASLEQVMSDLGWDVTALKALGNVEFENTRNLGSGSGYASVTVPGGGLLYSRFDLNRAYVDTDVLVSLAKLKEHSIAGVTLAMKNLFGVTPNSLYSVDADLGEAALGYRGVMHERSIAPDVSPPGEKPGFESQTPGFRVPRITADLFNALPLALSVIDGVLSMRGGEGPWSSGISTIEPRLLLAGRDAVALDAVGAFVLGHDPLGTFASGDNHIALAAGLGLGTADLDAVDVRGLTLEQARAWDA